MTSQWRLDFNMKFFFFFFFFGVGVTPVLLLGKSHGRRSLIGFSPWGRTELDTTEWLHFHISLSCIGEGNGNLLWCSCLENPRDGGAWWAAVYGVAQSQTRLKRLSSSSNNGTNIQSMAKILTSYPVIISSYPLLLFFFFFNFFYFYFFYFIYFYL